jgi:hypothetical protein
MKLLLMVIRPWTSTEHTKPQTRTSEERTKGSDDDTTTKYTEVHSIHKPYDT